MLGRQPRGCDGVGIDSEDGAETVTKQQKTNLAAAFALVPTVGAVGFWLLSTAFVPTRTYSQDQKRQDLATDSLRSQSSSLVTDIDELKRIGCASLTEDQKKIARACP